MTSTLIISTSWRAVTELKTEQTIAQQKYYIATTPVDMGNLELLDTIIADIFGRYEILTLSRKDNLYITDEMEQEMIRDIFTAVYTNISDDLIDKLTLIYKRSYIDDIIAQKVQMVIINYKINVNGNYKEE